jgi:hypothetical protein
MATRFAGDFFGVSLIEPQRENSQLLDYYPELRRMAKQTGGSAAASGEEGARIYGGAKAVPSFSGFKTLEKNSSTEQKAAPLFYGFKTFSQPQKTQ